MYIPEDVLEGILSRLPVESIIRFKCVCKSWYSLFKNPTFAAKHLSNQSLDHIFMKHEVEGRYDFCYLSKGINDNYAHFAVNVDLPFINNGFPFVLIGHCDGLMAYTYDEEDVRICNPATRELRTLPHSSLHPISLLNATDLVAVGFGYDSNTNDYKVVRVYKYYDPNTDPTFEHRIAEVFSIGSNDSSWRPIKYSLDNSIWFNTTEFRHVYYNNGIYYWLGTQGVMHLREAVLISFNMGDEEFQKVSLPDDCLHIFAVDVYLVASLGVYNNEFIAIYTFHTRQASMDVWVMKEFGVKESWTKVLTIEPVPVIMWRLVTFWKNDKELLFEGDERNLCSFDLVTKEFKCHGQGSIYTWEHWYAVPYMKTIVSVNTKEEEGIVY